MVRIADVPLSLENEHLARVTTQVARSMAFAFYPIDRIARLHTPHDWIVPDDRPLLVLHVNPEPGAEDEVQLEFPGLDVAPASRLGRRDRRGYTVDASVRYTTDSFIIGLSHRAGMLPARAAQELLDLFADALLEIAEGSETPVANHTR